MSRRTFITVWVVLVGLVVPAGLSQAALADHPQCQSGAVLAFGTRRWCGYFKNHFDSTGDAVRVGGVPGDINSVQELIDLIVGDLNSGNAHRRTAAQFVILTMLGRGPGQPQAVTPAQLAEWQARVRSYGDASENGSQSTGQNGRIDWYVSQHLACDSVNTYWQDGFDDVAPFLARPNNSDCAVPGSTSPYIIFRDLSGKVLYQIRRLCMNPVGALLPLAPPRAPDYTLTPAIATSVGGAPVSQGVEVGQTLQFSYSVANSGPDDSTATSCAIYANVHAGYYAASSPATASGAAGPATGCPRVFVPGSTAVASENIVVVAGNQTICRSLFINPASPTNGAVGTEACVPVVTKPYLKVYGGDISAGGGLATSPTTCAANAGASIVSWNNSAGSGYGGAGTQFAALAMGKIFELATASTGPSAAAEPSGLALANTAPAGSVYGGQFGTAPCQPDYAAAKPASTMAFTTLGAAITSGAYHAAGTVSLSGTVPAGKRITLYASGNVFIDGNITYPANWTTASTPLLQVVAQGNIYIKSSVSRVDGVFIAQTSAGGGGTIYTCTNGPSPLVADGSLRATCSTGLTINGAFVANDVQFLRTRGSRLAAPADEPNTSSNIAEVFNFGPAFWMAQPPGQSQAPLRYDAITSLPPIL